MARLPRAAVAGAPLPWAILGRPVGAEGKQVRLGIRPPPANCQRMGARRSQARRYRGQWVRHAPAEEQGQAIPADKKIKNGLTEIMVMLEYTHRGRRAAGVIWTSFLGNGGRKFFDNLEKV